MRWHDHGHDGTEPVIWLDALDLPLVRSLDAAWASKMRSAATPTTAIDSSQDEFTAAGLVPRTSRYEDTGYPQVRWPWRTVRAALQAMAAETPVDRPVVLRYVNPRTGSFPLRTMGCEAQWLRPGESTSTERRTGSGILHVIEGRGESRIGDETLHWERGIASRRRLGTGSSTGISRRRRRPASSRSATSPPSARSASGWRKGASNASLGVRELRSARRDRSRMLYVQPGRVAAGEGERSGGVRPPRPVRSPQGGESGERVTELERSPSPADGPRPASRSANRSELEAEVCCRG